MNGRQLLEDDDLGKAEKVLAGRSVGRQVRMFCYVGAAITLGNIFQHKGENVRAL